MNEASHGNLSAAIADARRAASINPLSVEPLSDLAAIYQANGDVRAAHRELRLAVSRQSSNPATWEALAQFDLQHIRWRSEASPAAARAHALDRGSATVDQLLAQAKGA